MPLSISLDLGTTRQINVVPRDASGNVVSGVVPAYASTDNAVAFVTADGVIVPVSQGTAIITVDVVGVTDTINVIVGTPVNDITVTVPPVTAYNTPVTATAVVHNGVGGVITGLTLAWSTNADPDVARINPTTGVLTVLADGTFDVICTVQGVSGEAVVSVALATTPYSITLTPTSLFVDLGLDAPAIVAVVRNVLGDIIVGAPVTWTVPVGGTVASVNSSGVVHGLDAGTATVQATAGAVSANVAVTVVAVAFTPQFAHYTVEDGYLPRTRTGAWADVPFITEHFSGGEAALSRYDRGNGVYSTQHNQTAPTGLLANSDRNSYYQFRANMTRAVAEVVRHGLQWESYTVNAAMVGDEDVYSRLLFIGTAVTADLPLKLWYRFKLRGNGSTVGKRMFYYIIANGTTILPITYHDLAGGQGTEISGTLTLPTGVNISANADIQLHVSWDNATNGVPAIGWRFDVLNLGVFVGQPVETALDKLIPEYRAGDPLLFGNEPQTEPPIHAVYGMAQFNGTPAFLGGETERYLDGPDWAGTLTRTITALPNPWAASLIAGNPGRFWYDAHAIAGAKATLQRTFGLAQSDPAGPGGDVPAASCAGKRAWVLMMVEKSGANPLPPTNAFRAKITGTAAYTGLFRQIPNGNDGLHYLYAAPVLIGAANVATAFGLEIENVSATTYDFRLGAIWVDREGYMPGIRDYGTFNAWRCPRKLYGSANGLVASGDDSQAGGAMRARYDNLAPVFDAFNHTIFRRDFLAFDPADVLSAATGGIVPQLKWWDGGPNATSLNTYIWELTVTGGELRFNVLVQNTGAGAPPGQKGVAMTWPVPSGLFRPYAFNDVVVTLMPDPLDATKSIAEVYINGTWLDKDTAGVTRDPGSNVAGANWTTDMLWISMDRDLDCALQGFYRACAIHGTPQPRAAVAAYAGVLNSAGVGQVL